MNGGNKISDNPPSANLSWVICKSNSHPGHNYYFNCITRESTWHLSESERSKAQPFEKVMSQIDFDKCAEPMNPPKSSNAKPPRIYNKQIINNQFPNQLHSDIYMPSMSAGSSGLVPKIWNTPPNTGLIPGQQFFLVPGTLIPALAQYTQPVNYVAPNIEFPQNKEYLKNQHSTQNKEYCHNINVPQSNEYQETMQFVQNNNYKNLGHPQSGEYAQNDHVLHEYHVTHPAYNKVNRFHNKFGRGSGRRNGINNNKQLQSKLPDLRHKLITNRRKSLMCKTDDEEDTDYQTDHTDGVIVEQHNTMNVLEESPSKYDLTKLKELNPTNTKSNPWIIAVDINILLKEFQFLDRLTDAEQNCYLMAPHHVMCDLQARALDGNDRNVKRIYRFLSEKIESGLAYRGADVSHMVEGVYDQTIMACMDCCTHSNVILLSDDTNFVEYKYNKYNIHIFTMAELKYVLEVGPPKNYLNLTKSNYPQSNKVTSGQLLLPTSHPQHDDDAALLPLNEIKSDQVKVSPLKDSMDAHTSRNDNKNMTSPASNTLDQPKQEMSLSIQTKTSPNTSTRAIRLNRSFKDSNMENQTPAKRRWRRQRVPINSQLKAENTNTTKQGVDANRGDDNELPQLSVYMESRCNDESPKMTPRTPSSDRSSFSSQSKGKGMSKTTEGSITSGYSAGSIGIKDNIRFKMRTVVTYEVDGEEMEGVLSTCRDEWVTRFVQIMEEVLKQKLLDNSALHLHEAVRSIIQKYSDHFVVVDAANKLSFILSQIRDDTGNIKADIDPWEYMEMYSYGVYLVETLKDISDCCEDLDAADVSLKKLLFDIKNSNHGIHNDSVIDGRHDSEILNTTEYTEGDAEITEHDIDNSRRESENYKENRELHSPNVEEESQNVEHAIVELKNDEAKTTKSPQKPITVSPQPKNKSTVGDNINDAFGHDTDVTVEPVIARNFVNLPQFEERIKKMKDVKNIQESFDDWNADEIFDYDYDCKTMESSINYYLDKLRGKSKTVCNDGNFMGFVKEFVGEIRGVMHAVVVLCYDIGSHNDGGREETLHKVKKAALLLSDISKSLESILDREIKRDNNVAELLKIANFDNFVPSEAVLTQYVDKISKCKIQVDCLHDNIIEILKAKQAPSKRV